MNTQPPTLTPTTVKPGGGMPYGNDDPKRRQKALLVGIGGVALVAAAVVLFVVQPWKHKAPMLGSEPAKLGQYASTPDFQKMPFEKRELYLKEMDEKKERFTKSYDDGQMSLEDYQKSMLAAHLGKELKDMRKYFAKPAGEERVKYLDKLLVKKDTKTAAVKHDPTAKEEKKEQAATKDDAAEKAEVATWPPEVQEQYQQYNAALAERKKTHKAEKAVKGSPATAPAE